MSFKIEKTSIDGALIISGPVFHDNRGFFHEIFRLNELAKMGVNFEPVQWSHSFSEPGVIRAIHSERWQKLIYPVSGVCFCAIVDVRPSSKTFLKVEAFTFDNTKKDSPHNALFLPPGVGNSLCVVGDKPVDYIYLVDEYWDNAKAMGIAWDDPDIGIVWPVKEPILSERDKNNPRIRDLFPEKFK